MIEKFENKNLCKCEICGHRWLSRNDTVPWKCPALDCQSFKWNREWEETERIIAMGTNFEQSQSKVIEPKEDIKEEQSKSMEIIEQPNPIIEQPKEHYFSTKGKKEIRQPRRQTKQLKKDILPKSLVKCPKCDTNKDVSDLGDNNYLCYKCTTRFEVKYE